MEYGVSYQFERGFVSNTATTKAVNLDFRLAGIVAGRMPDGPQR